MPEPNKNPRAPWGSAAPAVPQAPPTLCAVFPGFMRHCPAPEHHAALPAFQQELLAGISWPLARSQCSLLQLHTGHSSLALDGASGAAELSQPGHTGLAAALPWGCELLVTSCLTQQLLSKAMTCWPDPAHSHYSAHTGKVKSFACSLPHFCETLTGLCNLVPVHS